MSAGSIGIALPVGPRTLFADLSWFLVGCWTLLCAMLVVLKKLDLDGTLIRMRAAQFSRHLRILVAEAKAAIVACPEEVRESELELQRSRYFRFLRRPIERLWRETEGRYGVPLPGNPRELSSPLTIEEMERVAQWLWILSRSQAHLR